MESLGFLLDFKIPKVNVGKGRYFNRVRLYYIFTAYKPPPQSTSLSKRSTLTNNVIGEY